jgi:hypothetical protein
MLVAATPKGPGKAQNGDSEKSGRRGGGLFEWHNPQKATTFSKTVKATA